MSKKIRKWSDEYVRYGFTYITEADGSQRPQYTICDAKLSNCSLAPAKLKEHFLKMHGDGKYKNTTLAEFKIKRARYDEKTILPVFGFVPIDKPILVCASLYRCDDNIMTSLAPQKNHPGVTTIGPCAKFDVCLPSSLGLVKKNKKIFAL